jgi:thymidylate synthase (FAD)
VADVLDHGVVELVDSMGSDLSVVQAARISNGAAMPEWRGAADEKLINFLAANQHMTPFEHATFKFYIKAPLFVVREWQRHRTFSYNERSGRYKKFDPEFYIPLYPRIPDPKNKQSSIVVKGDMYLAGYQAGAIQGVTEIAFKAYENMLENGIAREVARMVLPLNLYTEFYATGNFRNWMHFINLRASEDAQYEIRVYAQEICDILRANMPLSVAALRKDGE